MDTPYRVERNERIATTIFDNSVNKIREYLIVRSGDEVLCRVDNIVDAYRLVDLLNREEDGYRRR
jgi:hypothetical protein